MFKYNRLQAVHNPHDMTVGIIEFFSKLTKTDAIDKPSADDRTIDLGMDVFSYDLLNIGILILGHAFTFPEPLQSPQTL